MMTEISLNILDVAQNSVRANATQISIAIKADTKKDCLCVVIADNGCGMTKEQVENVENPFFTTRTTRKVGLGVPFFKLAAEITGGSFRIDSVINEGTTVFAKFVLSSIDRMPLGDISATMYTLITMNTDKNFYYVYEVDDRKFILDTAEFKNILGDIPLNSPEVSDYIKGFLEENRHEVDNGIVL